MPVEAAENNPLARRMCHVCTGPILDGCTCELETALNGELGAILIRQERVRQIDKESYTPKHDNEHALGELSEAATCYAVVASAEVRGSSAEEWPASMLNGFNDSIVQWPWDEESWKPSDNPICNLVKAGALIAAEIDRLARRNPELLDYSRRSDG